MRDKLEFTPAEVAAYYHVQLPKLNQTRAGDWRGPCPIHRGKRDSFAVKPETGAAYCHSSCGRGWSLIDIERELHGGTGKEAAKRVLQIVGRPTARPAPAKPPPRIVAEYNYCDPDGREVFQNVRYEPKDFRMRHRTGRDWTWSVRGRTLYPYRLPQVLQAPRVLIVEGEKDVHTLEAAGFVATTNAGGAGKWRAEFAEYFAGREVIILPDNDAQGEKHAQDVITKLGDAPALVRLLRLPGLPPKGDVTDWMTNGGTREQLARLIEDAAAAEEEAAPEEDGPVALTLENFRADAQGVWWIDPRKEAIPLWLCPPLAVTALSRNLDSRNYGKLVEFTDTENRRRQAIIPHVRLFADGNEALEQLVMNGFHPSRLRRARERLKDYVWTAEPQRKVRSVSQIGWEGNCFVYPEESIGAPGEEEVFFYSEAPIEHKLKPRGTLAEWRAHIAAPCAGNSRMVFAVSCAFAAAMLYPLGHECIGFHYRGLSSTGKTTALRAAGSVWGGGGPTGFLETWRSTANGLEAKAALHNHALLCLDEISQVPEKEVGDIIYFLGNGAAKSRMTKYISARATITFRLVYLSTGERSLSELMRAVGKQTKGGQELRLAEIPTDAGKGMGMFETIHEAATPDQFAKHLIQATADYYGTAAPAFLRHVAEHMDGVIKEVITVQDQFVHALVPREAAGEVHRLASSFGLIAGAGELAATIGITGWKKGEARRAAKRCYMSWLDTRGGIGAMDIEHGIVRVRDFLERFGQARFEALPRHDGPPIRDRAGYREFADDADEWVYYVHDNVFKLEICGSYDYIAVYRELITRGFARTQAGRNLTVKKRIPGVGTPRFFVILPAIFEDDENENENEKKLNHEKRVGTVGTVGTENNNV